MERKKVLILLSGGLDSAVNLACAKRHFDEITTLTLNYLQKAADRELQSARLLAEHYNVRNVTLDIPWLGEITSSALVSNEPVPSLSIEELDDEEITRESARKVWVPNRNGLFLNIAASLCEAWKIPLILVGFNKEEGATFADNTHEFAEAMTKAFSFSTLSGVQVSSFTTNLVKREIIQIARELSLPLELLWSCYEGGEAPCEVCESCRRFQRALEEAS